MKIISASTEDRVAFLLNELKGRLTEETSIVVFFGGFPSLKFAFDEISKDKAFSNCTVRLRDTEIKSNTCTIRFRVADWQSFCGMKYDAAFCYDELTLEKQQQVLCKINPANNSEQVLYILKYLDKRTFA